MERETFKLSQPITAHGEQLTELQVRRPTPLECRQLKAFPYELNGEGLPVAVPDVAAKYMAVCCAIPGSSVDQLELADFNNLAWTIVGFFLNAKTAT